MSTNVPITVANRDGIGPEITQASLHILLEAGARIDLEVIEIGEKVWPDGIPETLLTDACLCRFTASNGGARSKKTVALLGRVLDQGLEIVKTETLRSYNGTAGYTLSQGQ